MSYTFTTETQKLLCSFAVSYWKDEGSSPIETRANTSPFPEAAFSYDLN